MILNVKEIGGFCVTILIPSLSEVSIWRTEKVCGWWVLPQKKLRKPVALPVSSQRVAGGQRVPSSCYYCPPHKVTESREVIMRLRQGFQDAAWAECAGAPSCGGYKAQRGQGRAGAPFSRLFCPLLQSHMGRFHATV